MSGLDLVPLEAHDLAWIRPHPGQPGIAIDLSPDTARILNEVGPAFAFLAGGNRRPIAGAGVILSMGPPGIAWAVLSLEAGPHFVALSRIVRDFVAAQRGPLETGVARGYERGARWATLMGFKATGRTVDRWDSRQNLEVWHRPAGV